MNKHYLFSIFISVLASLLCLSCSQNSEGMVVAEPETVNQTDYKLAGNTINVERVVGKGKIQSVNIAPVYSLVDGVILDMNLMEGTKVRKGQTLAVIDDSEAHAALMELESKLEMKSYEVRTSLIGLGYKQDQLENVPADVRSSVETMTGYSLLKLQIENQKYYLESHTVKAPFDGSILNVNVGKMFYARKGEPLFYVLDTENLLIRFEVLETSISDFSLGMPLRFSTLAYGDKEYDAVLLSIAPNVESTGMVVMTASIAGRHPELMPGMTIFVNY